MARRAVVRLGIPALIVAALAVAALWRVGPPPREKPTGPVATSGTSPAKPITEPVKTIAEVMSNNAIGREASLEHVRIREMVGERFYWIESGDQKEKWGTVGVSENIMEASWQALADSIEYKMLNEKPPSDKSSA